MAGYGNDATFQAFLDENGYTLPSGAPSLAVLRQRGSGWLDATYGARYRGTKVDFDQERGWPRNDAVVEGQAVPNTVVPLAIITAGFMAAWAEASKPGSLSSGVSSTTGNVKRQKVGQIEREFFSASDVVVTDGPFDPNAPNPATKIIADIDNLVRPYLMVRDFGAGIWGVGTSSAWDC